MALIITMIMAFLSYAIGSMYGIFTYVYHKLKPNVGKYTSPMDPMGTMGTMGNIHKNVSCKAPHLLFSSICLDETPQTTRL